MTQQARVRLEALTQQAREAIGGAVVEILGFPFRVGRECRGLRWTPEGFRTERRASSSRPNNDLYINDGGEALNVSREHFLIEADADGGRYLLVDRQSSCGTIVNGQRIGGGNLGGRTRLEDGDVIIVGTASSPYVLKFLAR